MILPAHFLMCKPGLKKTAGSCSRDIFSYKGIYPEHGECLLGKQYMASRPFLHTLQDTEIILYSFFVHQIYRCFQFLDFHFIHLNTNTATAPSFV